MNATKHEIEKEYARAKEKGWTVFFQTAANTITRGFFDAADLMAIASRETNLDAKWLKKPGDNGHGFGLLQADIRSFPEWIATGKWTDAEEGILKGAQILMQKWHDFKDNAGKTLIVRDHSGKSYRFVSKDADGALAQKIVVSSYNCGRWSQYNFSKNRNIDASSTGADYASDVMERAAHFRRLLENDSIPAETSDVAKSALSLHSDALQQNSVGDAEPAETSESDADASSSAGSPSQTAENITNVSTGDAAPKIAAATETEAVDAEAHAHTGFLAKVGGIVAAIAAGQYTIPAFLQSDSFLAGLFKAFEATLHALFVLRYFVFGAVALWFVFRKIESLIMRVAAMKANTDPTKSNVNIVNTPPSGFFTRIHDWAFGVKE